MELLTKPRRGKKIHARGTYRLFGGKQRYPLRGSNKAVTTALR